MAKSKEKSKKEVVYSDDFEKNIEDKRNGLYTQFKKQRSVSNFLTVGVLILAIGGMLLVTNENKVLVALGWTLLIAGLIVMLLYYFLMKKRFDNKTREYIEFATASLGESTFDDKRFTKMEYFKTKLEVNDVAANGAYNDIHRVASRNMSKGTFDSVRFSFSEAAFFTKSDKKNPAKTLFVGKYFDVYNALNFDGNIVIELSGKEIVDKPNAIETKEKLFAEGNLSIFADSKIDYKKILGEKFLENISKIKIADHLLNLCFSIWQGHTFVFMSYDDEVIAIPFEKPFNYSAFKDYKKQVVKIMESLTFLGK